MSKKKSLAAAVSLGIAGCAGQVPPTTAVAPALEVDLQHQPGMEPVAGEGRGRSMGSGDGRVRGAIAGEIRWTLFEVQRSTTCELHLIGQITTDGGEQVDVEAIGYGMRPSASSNRWDMTASATFRAPAGSPLAGRVAAWVGTFDARTGRHRYDVHLPARGSRGS